MHRWLVALLFGLSLTGARAVGARPTVVLLRAPNGHGSWRAAESRTRDELVAMGMEVEEVRALPTQVPRVLEERGPGVVVRIERTNDGASVEIWAADARAGSRRLAHVELGVAGDEAVATAALRVAEQVLVAITAEAGPAEPVDTLRVVTLSVGDESAAVQVPVRIPEVRAPSGPIAGEVVVPGVVVGDEAVLAAASAPAPAPSPRRLQGLAAQVAALGGPGGVGVLGDFSLALRVALGPRVSLAPTLSAAVAPVQVRTQDGSIRVGYVAGETWLGFAPGRLAARVRPRLAVGGGVGMAWARGRARSPLQGGTDLAVIGVLGGSAGVAIRARERLRLLVGAGIHILLAPIVVRIRGEEVARLGPVVILGSVGIEWDWPGR